jgi:hypothetical protein
MKNYFGAFLLLLFGFGVGGICYWELTKKAEENTVPITEKAPPPPEQSTPKYPVSPPAVEPASEAEHLPQNPAKASTSKSEKSPAINTKSWSSLEEAVSELLGKKSFSEFIEWEGLAHRVVVTVSNESSPQMPPDYLPWKKIQGDIAVDEAPDQITLNQNNEKRYKTVLKLFESVDSKTLVRIYTQFYSSFQHAYEEMGSKGYFNDRLVDAIDDALAAPIPSGAIQLEHTTLHFRFKNPDFESLSAGQKLMLRIGPENAAHLKSKLKEIRSLVTKLDKDQQG